MSRRGSQSPGRVLCGLFFLQMKERLDDIDILLITAFARKLQLNTLQVCSQLIDGEGTEQRRFGSMFSKI